MDEITILSLQPEDIFQSSTPNSTLPSQKRSEEKLEFCEEPLVKNASFVNRRTFYQFFSLNSLIQSLSVVPITNFTKKIQNTKEKNPNYQSAR
jgi:hypothetical protein